MKKTLLILFGQLLTLSVFAQSFSVEGKVVDATDGMSLPGAHVVFLSEDQTISLTGVTNDEGTFHFEKVIPGTYGIGISYIGFSDFTQVVKVEEKDINLGVIKMQEGIELQEIQVTEKVLTAIQLGDTTQFNAAAFKTLPDANAEDLLEKMPTVRIDNGKIQAQGEDVKRVLVDGKPFFGDDPTAAIRNLPAEVIDKIQIYDQQSDQAQFTGFDDGESSKTINIILKPGNKAGQFGKIYVGYGYEDKYQAGGNINILNGDQRISIIGMSNNVNQQNFSSEDLLGVVGTSSSGGRGRSRGGGRGGNSSGASASDFMVGQADGITSANAGGINFTDKWGEKTDVAANYFFNQSDNLSEQATNQQFFDTEGLNEIYDEQKTIKSTNTNHRFSGQLKYQMDENNMLNWRPKFSFQNNQGTQTTFGQTIFDTDILSQTNNDFKANLSAFNISNDLMWNHKFTKQGRTISTKITSGYAPKRGENYLLSENVFGSTIPDSISMNQNAQLDVNSWNVAADVRYTEPVGEKNRVMLNYRASYQQEESDKATFDFEEATQEYDLYNQALSNVFSNDYFTQQMGSGYSHQLGDLRLSADAKVQWVELLNQQSVPEVNTFNQTAWSFLPSASLRYKVSRTENFNFSYRTRTQLPSIDQLQNVVDNSNPLQLKIGNPNLKQAYSHNLSARYSKTNTEKSTVFFAMLSGSFANNYLGKSTYLASGENVVVDGVELTQGIQLTQPVNLDGSWNARSFLTYGFPVKKLKSNLNVDLSASVNRNPAMVNEELNFSNNTNTGIGLTFSSNINDRIDFTLSSRSNYNTVHNTVLSNGDNQYFNQNSRLKFNWLIGSGFIFRTDLTHQFYNGLADGFDQNYLLWNMSIGKKIFKDQRGEINLSVFDLLRQNNSLTQNITDLYTETVQTNVLQQYALLSFKYDLNHFVAK